MRALITGAGGFIGSFIADALVEKGDDVWATVYNNTKNLDHLKDRIKILRTDIGIKENVERLVKESDPEIVFHMAAQSFVIPSWNDPEKTFSSNIMGTHYLLESLRKAGTDPIIAVASSSAAYGLTYPEEIPIKETKEFRPSSPYAVSKATTDMLAFLYWRAHGMKTLRLRFFNTIGPRKTGSAIAEWSQGVAEIEHGLRNELGIGNLDAVLDLTDVRDTIEAIFLLTEKGKWGDAYNVCNGHGHKMKDILDKIVGMSKTKIKIVEDPKKFRHPDDPIFIGDNSKLVSLGWKAETGIDKTLLDTLNYWREETKKAANR